ncbi:2-C-methyl-D-erythritol 4-phosphate cytidylyltransferase [bacterium BMS3Abin03]|nr:2-C-methyl-D-erythritol 4-phosphate cytidylyltransferase [bacterium BMS3Abin03]HDZ59021.1 2-C-methyl-D-erythritol 4-phosphate cytidylyltransferase [Ignavibacteriales bacterium]
MKTIAIIPAGGKGVRSGSSAPKQYLKFNDKELIVYTLETFQKNTQIDEIILSAEPAYFSLLNELKEKYKLTKISKVIEGGKERQDSVYNALTSLNDVNDDDLIAVHDAARPLLPQKVLTGAIDTAKEKGNALVCIKAKDTLIKADMFVRSYLNRDEVYYVQTPQIFPYSVLMKAMKNAYANDFTGTDESVLVRRIGEKINIAEGSVFNFKITAAEDIEMFEKLIST